MILEAEEQTVQLRQALQLFHHLVVEEELMVPLLIILQEDLEAEQLTDKLKLELETLVVILLQKEIMAELELIANLMELEAAEPEEMVRTRLVE